MDQQQLGKHGPRYKRWQPLLLDRNSLIRQGHPSLTLEVEENWTLEYVRKELEVAIQNPPDQFCFKLDGRKVSRRREHQIICKDVAPPQELEVLEDL